MMTTAAARPVVIAFAAAVLLNGLLAAQAPPAAGQGAPPPAPPTPRAAAPIDLTGFWVPVISEDWRWRMIAPPKGDYASIPVTEAAKLVGDQWEPSMDGRCEAYGAAGVMRMPLRLRITWESDTVLKVETDAGEQTRRFVFGPSPEAPPSRQGSSAASWELSGARGRGAGAPAPPGSLRVSTTRLLPGWLRRNGVPYSEQTVLTEYFDRFEGPGETQWFTVTSIVRDPKYLAQDYITSTHFRRESDGSRWMPTPCRPG